MHSKHTCALTPEEIDEILESIQDQYHCYGFIREKRFTDAKRAKCKQCEKCLRKKEISDKKCNKILKSHRWRIWEYNRNFYFCDDCGRYGMKNEEGIINLLPKEKNPTPKWYVG